MGRVEYATGEVMPRNGQYPEHCQVLLVEDNPDHAELIRRNLEKAGDDSVRLDHVASYKEAAARLEGRDVDVVLLDLGLPDIEFAKTLPSLVEAFPEVPVVVLTSLDDLEYAGRAVQYGAQDYLVKSELSGQLLLRSIKYSVERKRHALELLRSNAELQRFASTIAHEIRSPLAVVLSFFSILVKRYGDIIDDKTLALLDETTQRTKDIGTLVTDLLEFAKFDPELNFRSVKLNRVVDEVAEGLGTRIARKRAKVTRDELPELLGDFMLLRQLMHNLISNAIKYSEGEPIVHISCKESEEQYTVYVKDNGPGIEPEMQETIFQLFKRGKHPRSVSGTGIGLAFSKRIVEHHGGKIWVESKEGAGSTFCFTLPKEIPNASSAAPSGCS